MPATNIVALAANTPVSLLKTPLLNGQPAALSTHTGTPTVYGANLQPASDDTKRGITAGDGSKRSWNVTDLPALDGAHDDAGTLATADILRVIAFVEGVLQKRVVSSTPTALLGTNEFKLVVDGLQASASLALLDQPTIGDEFKFIDAEGATGWVEFYTATGGPTTGSVGCLIGSGVATTATNLAAAVNGTGMTAKVTAGTPTTTGGTVYRIPLYQDIGGTTGNTAITYSGTNLSGTDFSGGTDDGETMVFSAVPPLGAKVDVSVQAATDITTYNSGALTANIRYEVSSKDVVVASSAARIEKLYN